MAGQGSGKGDETKRAAERAAKVVLAKHPRVIPGSVTAAAATSDVASPRPNDVEIRNIGRGLKR